MTAVFKRELRACLCGLRGWGSMALILFASGIGVAYYNFFGGSSDILYAMTFAECALIPAIPLLCMSSMARDRADGTERFLLSLPVENASVVVGKYLAMLCVVAMPFGVMCLYPLVFSLYGTVGFAAAYTDLFGFFLLCAGLIAICQFLSGLTGKPLVALIMGVAVMLVLYFFPLLGVFLPTAPWVSFAALVAVALLIAVSGFFFTGSWITATVTACVLTGALTAAFLLVPELFSGLFGDLTRLFSPFSRYEEAKLYGLFDVNVLLLLLSVPPLFVYLTTATAERRRCR